MQRIETLNPQGICYGCLNPSAHLADCVGDLLCEKCRAVIEAALVLLNRNIADEAVIISTLALAKVAGGSRKYAALVENLPSTVNIKFTRSSVYPRKSVRGSSVKSEGRSQKGQ